MRAGVDTGGTFTDFVFWDGDQLRSAKRPSTPDDPSQAILSGVAETRVLRHLVHGSTVATNALLERRGVETAFVSTAGFEDMLEIGRQNRPRLYDWSGRGREELIPRNRRFGARERTTFEGEIVLPLESDEVERIVSDVKASGAASVAVCLLHAYAAPAHEKRLGDALRAAGLHVSLSHEVLPEYREYERASTTAVNAYVSPLMRGYLQRLASNLGATTRLRVFQSNGGSMSAETAGREAVHTVLSGPAGGVRGAAAVAAAAGFDRILTFDMGGTSTDVALCDGGLGLTQESRVGGLPIRVPMLDIHTVGAGGGSIAYWDAGGALRVGPESAGADPGPACYGRGDRPTVTDANLILGRIDPGKFLDGAMELDSDRARSVLSAFAAKGGVPVERAAEGIITVANSNMERALRRITVDRGLDPREFTLVAFGGAGPMHACELADRLEIPTVLAPRDAGVLSALGMLTADVVRDFSQSVLESDPGPVFEQLESRARRELTEDGFTDIALHRSVDLRYRGQSFEITLPWNARESFGAKHEQLYGYRRDDSPIETVAVRVQAVARNDADDVVRLDAPADAKSYSTLYEPPGWSAREEPSGNTILRRSGRT